MGQLRILLEHLQCDPVKTTLQRFLIEVFRTLAARQNLCCNELFNVHVSVLGLSSMWLDLPEERL